MHEFLLGALRLHSHALQVTYYFMTSLVLRGNMDFKEVKLTY